MAVVTYEPKSRHRRSIRLRDYNYAQAGAYCITICSGERACIFGDVVEDAVYLTPSGEIVVACWQAIPEHFPAADLDAFVVMPNHLHGIVVLGGRTEMGTACRALLASRLGPLPPGRITSLWPTNYYEHVIRNESSLQRQRAYIAGNPVRWSEDSLHPDRFEEFKAQDR